jgi:hypothetical protein
MYRIITVVNVNESAPTAEVLLTKNLVHLYSEGCSGGRQKSQLAPGSRRSDTLTIILPPYCLKAVAEGAKHKFRAAFATKNLWAGVDLRTVRQSLALPWAFDIFRLLHCLSQNLSEYEVRNKLATDDQPERKPIFHYEGNVPVFDPQGIDNSAREQEEAKKRDAKYRDAQLTVDRRLMALASGSQMLLVVAWILVQIHTAKKVLKTGIRTQGIKQQVRF